MQTKRRKYRPKYEDASEPHLGTVTFVNGLPVRPNHYIFYGSRHEHCRQIGKDKQGPVYECKETRE